MLSLVNIYLYISADSTNHVLGDGGGRFGAGKGSLGMRCFVVKLVSD